MKKSFLLIFFIVFSLVSQGQKKVNVSILTDVSLPTSSSLLSQLQNEIKVVVGQDATIIFDRILENNFNKSKAISNYRKLLESDTDIILSFGVINTIVLHNEESYPKPVIVFGDVNSDLIELDDKQKTSQKNNITYVITPLSYSKDLEAFNELYKYKNIGIIVDDYLLGILPLDKTFDTIFLDKEASYVIIPISEINNNANVLSNVDAVYLTGGFHLSDVDFDEMVSAINQKKLPSFSALGMKQVEKGILATNQPENNIDQFFRRIALNVEAIIAGTNASELPLYILYKNRRSINYSTAMKINFPIKYSVLANSDFIGNDSEAENENSLSMLDIMNKVIGGNLPLKAEKKNIDIIEQDVKTAKSDYLPSLVASTNSVYLDPKIAEISNGQNPEFSTSGNVTLKQLIYSESASANTDIQKELKKAQVEVYNAAELDALLNAAKAYFNALILKANVRIQNQNLQVTKRNLELAEQNFTAGASGKSDVLRFRSQLAQNTQSFIEAGNQLKKSYNTINQLINVNISSKISIEDAELAKGLFKSYTYEEFLELIDNPQLQPALIAFLTEEALKNAPELKNIDYNLNAIERNYKLNNTGRYIPSVAIQGVYNLAITESGKGSTLPVGIPVAPDTNYNIGLNISLPLFQQNKRNINKQKVKFQEEQLSIEKDNLKLNIEKNVNDVILEIINQIANIEISKVAEESAKESLELTQNSYKNGAVPVIQLIDAQNNYLQSKLASTTANYNYLLASMQLERVIGYFFLMNTDANNEAFITRANQFILNKN